MRNVALSTADDAPQGRRAAVVGAASPAITGRVVTVQGRPVVGALVDIAGLGTRVTTEEVYSGEVDPEGIGGGWASLGLARTDGEGRFRISLADKDTSFACFGIHVEASGFGDAVRFLDELPEEDYRFVLGGSPSVGLLRGLARDRDGVPVQDLVVRFSIPEDAEVRSEAVRREIDESEAGSSAPSFPPLEFRDCGGRFEVPVPLIVKAWDRFRVSVTADGYSGDAKDVRCDSFRDGQELLFDLRPGRVLRGRVVDETGTAIQGARIIPCNTELRQLEGEDGSYARVVLNGESTRSDGEGRFEITAPGPLGVTADGLEEGLELESVRVEAAGFGPFEVRAGELDFDAGELLVELHPSGGITGRVWGPSASSGLHVLATSSSLVTNPFDSPLWSRRADVKPGGTYRFDDVPSGEVYLALCSDEGMLAVEQRVDVHPGERAHVDFAADEWGALRGILQVDLSGSVLEGTRAADGLAFTVVLFAAGPDGPHAVAVDQVTSGEAFCLPSLGTAGLGSFLRVAVNEDWFLDLPVEGLGADLDLGRLALRLTDFEVRERAVGGQHPPVPGNR
ncbi:MAG TPA: hypothetical protein ENJ09_13265 [Planctomycetes bacterium]|nr:hypothetical protein [Planctomycetota bacterium]